jgi:hypothetical protein
MKLYNFYEFLLFFLLIFNEFLPIFSILNKFFGFFE